MRIIKYKGRLRPISFYIKSVEKVQENLEVIAYEHKILLWPKETDRLKQIEDNICTSNHDLKYVGVKCFYTTTFFDILCKHVVEPVHVDHLYTVIVPLLKVYTYLDNEHFDFFILKDKNSKSYGPSVDEARRGLEVLKSSCLALVDLGLKGKPIDQSFKDEDFLNWFEDNSVSDSGLGWFIPKQ